jgi:hypothetical protein
MYDDPTAAGAESTSTPTAGQLIDGLAKLPDDVRERVVRFAADTLGYTLKKA